MAEILLRPKGSIAIMIEAEVISPDIFAGKKKEEIERLVVWQGPVQLPLAEFFDVDASGAGSPEETSIIIKGDVSRIKRIGQGMKAGSIEIQGPAGMHLGAEMAGGSIWVQGDAGSWAGREMKGGLLHIAGSTGDHVGSAYRGSWRGMTGGTIQIDGNARSQLGGGLVGGQIVVAGNVENFCGIRQSGGLILVKGSAVRGTGAEMNGGTIAVCGAIKQFSPGFVEAGREENPKLGDVQLEGWFAKFTGDYALGKNPKGSFYCREG
ncbi:MAG: formylmethanofuran dehydrogenase subunit C [Methanothrix sp.]|jgi:formylmethanofuran dehydrogenase subunit C